MSRLLDVIGYWLRRAQLADAEVFALHFSELDLTSLQAASLFVIEENPGISLKGLANIVAAKSSVLVKPIEKLESRGLIDRNRAAPDRRLQSVTLTDAGRKMAARAHEEIAKIQAILLHDIDTDQQKILIDCLSRVVSNVERMND